MGKTRSPTAEPTKAEFTRAPTISPSEMPSYSISNGTVIDVDVITSDTSAWYDFNTNEIIVYSTLLVLAVVFITCVLMYLMRPSSKSSRKLASTTNSEGFSPLQQHDPLDRAENGNDNSIGNSNGNSNNDRTPVVKKKVKKISTTGSIADSTISRSTTATGNGLEKKKKKKIATASATANGDERKTVGKASSSTRRHDAMIDDNSSVAHSEASSSVIFGGGIGGGGMGMGMGYGDGKGDQSAMSMMMNDGGSGGRLGGYNSNPDAALLSTFTSVMQHGINVMLHTAKGPKQIQLTMDDTTSTLKWNSAKMFARKKNELQLSRVLFIELGKQTNNFHLASAKVTADDLCFSLVTQDSTLDIEASSKVERDALAQGFAIMLARIHYHSK